MQFQQIDEFKHLMTQLNEISDKIIRVSIPLLKRNESLKSQIIELTNDSKCVKTDLNNLIKYIFKNVDEKEIPYLSQVWEGDVYGTQGISALQELLKDLQEQYEKLNLLKPKM